VKRHRVGKAKRYTTQAQVEAAIKGYLSKAHRVLERSHS
jgi:hypothetical protein